MPGKRVHFARTTILLPTEELLPAGANPTSTQLANPPRVRKAEPEHGPDSRSRPAKNPSSSTSYASSSCSSTRSLRKDEPVPLTQGSHHDDALVRSNC